MFDRPKLPLPHAPNGSDWGRRAFDLTVAVLALVLTAPLMVLIALAIRLEAGGPIFFGQVRLGRGSQRFVMYKFRKFCADAGSDGSPLTMRDDARMTRIGRVLMLTKLDELPQLWNIVRGEMAIIGPRPESLAFADCFRDGFELLLDHKPGLLGPCQILFRDEAALYAAEPGNAVQFYRAVLFPAKARIDLAYLERRTLASDALLLLRGVLAVCRQPRASESAQVALSAGEPRACTVERMPVRPAIAADLPVGAST